MGQENHESWRRVADGLLALSWLSSRFGRIGEWMSLLLMVIVLIIPVLVKKNEQRAVKEYAQAARDRLEAQDSN